MGIVVVSSIGNSDGSGGYSVSSPGVGQEVIGVASFDNTHVRLPAFRISPDSLAVGFSPASGAPLPPGSGTLPVRRTGTLASSADGCSSTVPAAPPPPGSVEGAAALIRHGGCGFYEKAINAQAAGAVAVVLSNNAPGQLNAAVTPPADPPGQPAVTIPVAHFDHQSYRMRMTVQHEPTGLLLGRALYEEYLPRNSGTARFSHTGGMDSSKPG